MGRVISIPVVSAHEIGGDLELFYERYARQPVIVRDCYAETHPLRQLDLAAIEALMGNIPIHVYGAAAENYREVPASSIFAGVRGEAEPFNVVDFYLAGTKMGALFEVPAFLRQNWFLGEPAGRDQYEKSLVVSPAGSFTALHQDSYAMQGWMYLIAGRKRWTCYSPDSVAAAFHAERKRFYHSREDSATEFPGLEACDRYEGTIGAGDLFYFPAGWIHEVATDAVSYGVGGSVLNDFQIEDHMRWWLWEREMGFEGSMDLKRVIAEMPERRFANEAGKRRAAAALAACERWESMREMEFQR